ncbi:MAG: hypothetical protein ACW98I_15920 [Candidatus Hodarchaeales archaeon]|jgi:hypothetical protein
MWQRFFQLIKDSGFRLPREHGLTSIWTGTVCLGIGMSIMNDFDTIRLSLSIIFATSVLFSADSMMKLAKNPSRMPEWKPISVMILTAISLLLWALTEELLLILSLIGLLSLGWAFFSHKTRQVNPTELVLGTISIGLLALVIFIVSVKSVSPTLFRQILIINWAFIAVSMAHIQYVETLRNKLAISTLLLTWILLLLTISIPVSFSVVTIVIFLPLIEPTIFVLLQTYKRELLKNSNRKIKTIGLQLMFRCWVVVILILLFYPAIILK